MKPKRICVVCKDPLGSQKYTHQSSKQGVVYQGSNWCNGPRKTPGGGRGPVRSPIHFRHYAAGYYGTLCGLKAGRLYGKYKDDDAQVPWSRVKVDLEQTNCVECLAMIAEETGERLRRLLKPDDSEAAARERAQGRLTMNGIRKVVGA